jgi:hypothetical protein
VSGDHAIVIGQALDCLSPTIPVADAERAETHLVEHVASLSFEEFRILANRVVEVVDPDGADKVLGAKLAAEEKRAMEKSVFSLRRGLDGVASFHGKMPNLHASMLLTSLEALASPRRDHLRGVDCTGTDADAADPSAADNRQSVDPATGRLIPYGQRLGRAFCEWIEKLPVNGGPPGNSLNATLVVTIDEQSLRDGVGTAALSTGDDLSVGEARRLACRAGLLPIVLGSDSAPLDLGRARRLFSPYQKIALAQRDGGCVFPGCDRPPAWTEAHHARLPWANGGKTDVKDGCLLCGFHHRLIHADEWQIAFAADGIPEVIPPTRVDTMRRPIRHQRLRPRAG